MDTPSKAPKHLSRVGKIARLPENLAVEHYDRIGTEHQFPA
jgi:hypothetical protein